MSTAEERPEERDPLQESGLAPDTIDELYKMQRGRRKDERLKRGVEEWNNVAGHPQTGDLIRAAGDGDNLLFRVNHSRTRRGRLEQPHDGGLSLALGLVGPDEKPGGELPVITVIQRDGRQAVQEPPAGGAWNLPCAHCGALISIRDVKLLQLALHAVVAGNNVITLT